MSKSSVFDTFFSEYIPINFIDISSSRCRFQINVKAGKHKCVFISLCKNIDTQRNFVSSGSNIELMKQPLIDKSVGSTKVEEQKKLLKSCENQTKEDNIYQPSIQVLVFHQKLQSILESTNFWQFLKLTKDLLSHFKILKYSAGAGLLYSSKSSDISV